MGNEGPYTEGHDTSGETATLRPTLADRTPTRRDGCRSAVPDRVGNLTVRPVSFHRIHWSAVGCSGNGKGGIHQCAT